MSFVTFMSMCLTICWTCRTATQQHHMALYNHCRPCIQEDLSFTSIVAVLCHTMALEALITCCCCQSDDFGSCGLSSVLLTRYSLYLQRIRWLCSCLNDFTRQKPGAGKCTILLGEKQTRQCLIGRIGCILQYIQFIIYLVLSQVLDAV